MIDVSEYWVESSDAVERWAKDNYSVLIDCVEQVLGKKYTSGGKLCVHFDDCSRQLCLFYGPLWSEVENAGTYDIVSSVCGDIEKYPFRFMSEGNLNKLAREVLPEEDLNKMAYHAAKSLVEDAPVAFALDDVRGFSEEILPGNKYDALLRAAVFNVIRDSPYLVRDGGPMREVAEDVFFPDEGRLILGSVAERMASEDV